MLMSDERLAPARADSFIDAIDELGGETLTGGVEHEVLINAVLINV